ncbi:MAG TPA: hypothetical protein VF576_04800, partial [Rubricoccaceae bacterium]
MRTPSLLLRALNDGLDTLGGPAPSPSGPSYDVYADSAAAPGSGTASSPYASLADAGGALSDDDALALAAGSSWREGLDLAALSDVSVVSYGSGPLPVVDGSDVVAPGAFAASAHGDAAGVVYETAWTRGPGPLRGQDTPLLWEDDARLVQVASVALCAATPGTYHAATPQGATSTLYVHPFGSTNPTSDGKTYEVTTRIAAVDALDAPGVTAEGLHLRRGWGHYGPFSGGTGATLRRSVVEGGGIHHVVQKGGLLEDVVVTDMTRTAGGGIPATFYTPGDGAGVAPPVARRVVVVGEPGALANAPLGMGGLYAHTDDPAGWPSIGGYRGSAVSHAATAFDGLSAGPFPQVGNYAYACGIAHSLAGPDASVRYGVARECRARPNGEGGVLNVGGVSGATGTRVIEHEVVYTSTLATTAYSTGVQCPAMRGSITLRHCVLVVDSGTHELSGAVLYLSGMSGADRLTVHMEYCVVVQQRANVALIEADHVTYTGHHNVFARLDYEDPIAYPYFKLDGVVRQGLTAWFAASGETDSVALIPSQYAV